MRIYILNMKENHRGSIEKYPALLFFFWIVADSHYAILRKGVVSSKKVIINASIF